ncbi:hypothetical protein I3842_Q133300 [Carya illinoinensis]|uniref:Uncharacterized protein n=1 Tax=Carya illinoinensis TaxID=32201 RepID=A0A922A0I9_CARIL|nr:hypothetical protein I3842_Q133300 [Carya illinoinensis]
MKPDTSGLESSSTLFSASSELSGNGFPSSPSFELPRTVDLSFRFEI